MSHRAIHSSSVSSVDACCVALPPPHQILLRLLDAGATTHLEDTQGRDALAHALVKGIASAAAALRLRGARLPTAARPLLPLHLQSALSGGGAPSDITPSLGDARVGASMALTTTTTTSTSTSASASSGDRHAQPSLDTVGQGGAPGMPQMMFDETVVASLRRPVFIAQHTAALLRKEDLKRVQLVLLTLYKRYHVGTDGGGGSGGGAAAAGSGSGGGGLGTLSGGGVSVTRWADADGATSGAAGADPLVTATQRGSSLSVEQRARALLVARARYAAARRREPYTFIPSTQRSVGATSAQLHASDSLMARGNVAKMHPDGLWGEADGPLSGLWCVMTSLRYAARPLL